MAASHRLKREGHFLIICILKRPQNALELTSECPGSDVLSDNGTPFPPFSSGKEIAHCKMFNAVEEKGYNINMNVLTLFTESEVLESA